MWLLFIYLFLWEMACTRGLAEQRRLEVRTSLKGLTRAF